MGQERGVAVRPAGAPMVPVERPSWARAEESNGSGSATDEVAVQARQAGQEVVSEARDAAGQVAAEAKDAGHLAAEDARDIAQTLRGKGRDAPARLADQAADRLEEFARYLRDADADRIMSDIRRVGREQPAAVVAGAAVVGVLIGRVVKASEPSHRGTSAQLPSQTTGGAR